MLRIFSDTPLDEPASCLLRAGIEPHELVLPARFVASVLASSGPDPALNSAEIAFGQPGVAAVLAAPRLRWLQLTSAGFTRFDTPAFREAARERGLVVTNSSSVYARPCAEHVFSFMLAQARALPQALTTQAPSGSPEWLRLRGAGRSLRGQKVLILGYGAIAEQLLPLLAPFALRVTAYRRRARGDEAVPIVTDRELPAALAAAEHIINILPENADSRGFFSAERFALLRPGAIFYNIGRGSTVQQEALLHALQHGPLAAAWLDVTEPEPLPPEHPLLHQPNCHCTPHTAGGHAEEGENLVRHFIGNFGRFLAGTPLQDRIM